MANVPLYPIQFRPILKAPLWGGQRLAQKLNKDLTGLEICGESWEISGVEGNVSVVKNGPLKGRNLVELIELYKSDLLGAHCYSQFGNQFPLLIKFIDANQDLSIQVHPDDDLAMARHGSFGKTEMWYVIDAEEDSTLISGFNRPTNRDEYLEYFNSGRLMELLNREAVTADDVFFLPAGRVHTIGKGLLIAEIQQSSDLTYRIYDFDRVDKDGNKRELHIEAAIEAIDYTFYDQYKTAYDHQAIEAELVSSKYFVTRRLIADQPLTREYRNPNAFRVIMVLEGRGSLETSIDSEPYVAGDTYLIPATIKKLSIIPEEKTKLLEVYPPS